MPRWPPILAALTCGATLLTGCGGNDASDTDKAAITNTIKGYLTALAAAREPGSGARACAHLTGAGKAQLLTAAETQLPESGVGTCAEAAELVGGAAGDQLTDALKDSRVADITMDGDSATAVPETEGRKGNRVTLRRIDKRWLIDGGLAP